MFEDMIIPCLKLVYTMYEDIIIFFDYIIFQGIFTLCMKTCLHKDTWLIAFLQNAWLKIDKNLK